MNLYYRLTRMTPRADLEKGVDIGNGSDSTEVRRQRGGQKAKWRRTQNATNSRNHYYYLFLAAGLVRLLTRDTLAARVDLVQVRAVEQHSL